VVGGLAACAIAYVRRGHDVLDSALTLPLGTSAVTVGFGLLLTFSRPPVDLRGSWIIVPIGQALVAIPLVVRTVLPVLRALDPRLREVAATLGASPARSWRTIDLPVLSRALGGRVARRVRCDIVPRAHDVADAPRGDRPAHGAPGRGQHRPGGGTLGRARGRDRARRARHRAAARPGDGIAVTGGVPSGLRVDGVTVSLGGVRVLDDVDLAVRADESVALLGPSGVGKSTLLRVVAGLVEPDDGRVLWDGVDITARAPHRRRIGLVFQDAVLFPHRDVGANVGYGLEIAGMPAGERRAEVARLLALVDLEGYADRDVATLSGGQAQRVALARALAPRPALLLLDEPFGALDRELRVRLGAEVRTLLRDLGVPAVHVTHDPHEAALVADRVLRLVAGDRGAIIADA